MNNDFINLLASFVSGEIPKLSASPDWQEIINLGKIHAVCGMLHVIVERLSDDKKPNEEIQKLLFNVYYKNIMDMAEKNYISDEILKQIDNISIDAVVFKGAVIKDCYPIPELRTMNDTDLLIKPSDRKKTDKFFADIGAARLCNSEPVFEYKYGKMCFEVHTKFTCSVRLKPTLWTYFDKMWENSVSLTDHIKIPTVNFHLLIIIFHTYKHFSNNGCGIRHFMDIALYINKHKSELDIEYLKNELEYMNLIKFARLSAFLCNRWFGTENIFGEEYDEEILNLTTDYVLKCGVFGFELGNTAQKAVSKRLKDKKGLSRFYAKLKFFMFKTFPPYRKMKNLYAYLEKYPVLLPFAWCVNIFRKLKYRKNHALQYTKNIFEEKDDVSAVTKLFSRLDI